MNNVINLCNRKGACCPTATLHDEEKKVTITDDDGGKVIVSWEAVEMLYREIRKTRGDGSCKCSGCKK